jgi:hypothetical protein
MDLQFDGPTVTGIGAIAANVGHTIEVAINEAVTDINKHVKDTAATTNSHISEKDRYWRDRMDNWNTLVKDNIGGVKSKLDEIGRSLIDLIRGM